jgi:hypothetical protein
MRQPSRGRQKRIRPATNREKSTPEASTTGVNSNIESMAFEMIKKAGEKGLLQTDLLKILGTDKRRGSKLVSGLEEQGLISKSRELYRGKWTYRLALLASKIPVVTWGDMDCPCFFCNDSGRCGLGNVVSPSSCSDLSGWLRSFIEGKNANQPSTQPA